MRFKTGVSKLRKMKKNSSALKIGAIIFFIIVMIGCLIVFTGYGFRLKAPYDKYVKKDTSHLSETEIYQMDLDFIYNEIKNNYVNLPYKEQNFHFSWDELYAIYSSQIEDINNEKEFYKLCREYLAYLKDGHLSFPIANNKIAEQVKPYADEVLSAFDVRMIEDKPIIVKSNIDQTIVGCEVLSMNEVNFLEIMETMKHYFYRTGNEVSVKTQILLDRNFYDYFALFYEEPPEMFNLLLKEPDGTIKQIDFDINKSYVSIDDQNETAINLGLDTYSEKLPVYKVDEGIGYIKISTFEGRPKDVVGEFDKAIQEFKEQKVKGVIIDVRYNSGGNESFRDILGYLTKNKIIISNYRYYKSERFDEIFFLRPWIDNFRNKPNAVLTQEKGYTKWWSWEIKPAKEQFLSTIPVVLLTNESIFSSTDSFAAACLENNLAIVIGNMVPLSGNGLPASIYLPSKKYILKYGFQENKGVDGSFLENIVKEPDLFAAQSLDDFYMGIDTQLEKGRAFINEK